MHSDWVIFLQYFNAYIRFIRKYFATNLNWNSETREFKENSFKVLHLSIEKKIFLYSMVQLIRHIFFREKGLLNISVQFSHFFPDQFSIFIFLPKNLLPISEKLRMKIYVRSDLTLWFPHGNFTKQASDAFFRYNVRISSKIDRCRQPKVHYTVLRTAVFTKFRVDII